MKLVLCIVIAMLLCGCEFKAEGLHNGSIKVSGEGNTAYISEVKINGHTYIVGVGGSKLSICPTAETLRWAYQSQIRVIPKSNEVEY